jgi:DNA-directed RNA polymerase subunit alpha
MRHLSVIGGMDPTFDQYTQFEAYDEAREPMQNSKRSQLHDKMIEELDLSVRVFNSLKRTGITTIGDVLEMLDRGSDAMLAIRNFGEKSLDELVEKLREKGYLPSEQTEGESE